MSGDREPPPVVTALGCELQKASMRKAANRAGSRPRNRLALAAAVTMVMAVAGAASATTGVFDVGDVIPGGEPTAGPDHRLAVPETILATGRSSVAGAWRISAFESARTVADGEVVEPAGLSCLRLRLESPPADTPIWGTRSCGDVEGDFSVGGLPVVGAGGLAELLLYGRAPESTDGVRLTGSTGEVTEVDTYDGTSSYPHDVWLIAASPDVEDARVSYVSEEGRVVAAPQDVSSQFERAQMLEGRR